MTIPRAGWWLRMRCRSFIFHCDYAFFPRRTGFGRVYDQSHDNRLHTALPLFFARRADMQ